MRQNINLQLKMKYIFILLLVLPLSSYGQKNCTSAYIHVFSVLDSLPVPPQVQVRIDSAQNATAKELAKKKTAYTKKYKSPKTVAIKLQKDESVATANNLKLKHSWMQKAYVSQVRDATLKIYDKGKKYNSVMNADSPYFANLPPDSCDVTAECLKLVREE